MTRQRLVRSTLARIRIEAGYETAEKGAAALGCSRVHLLNIEGGRAHPSPALLATMADRYGVTRLKLENLIARARKELLVRLLKAHDHPVSAASDKERPGSQ